jgi:hypothetical protein
MFFSGIVTNGLPSNELLDLCHGKSCIESAMHEECALLCILTDDVIRSAM